MGYLNLGAKVSLTNEDVLPEPSMNKQKNATSSYTTKHAQDAVAWRKQ
ncbi:hypothetical protein [Cytobacillus purgationiresistens]|nr:hypothetical protein [Cytobacillus purgationiresistens]